MSSTYSSMALASAASSLISRCSSRLALFKFALPRQTMFQRSFRMIANFEWTAVRRISFGKSLRMCWKNSGWRFGKDRSSNQRMFVNSFPSQSSRIRLMSAPAAVQVLIVKDAGPVCQAMCSRISATSACPLFKQKSSVPCSIWPMSPSALS